MRPFPFSLLLGLAAAASAAPVERLPPAAGTPRLESTLEVITVNSAQRREVYTGIEDFEAPNWSHDGRDLFVTRAGRICRIPAAGGKLEPIDTGSIVHCNNDHGFSPDGTWLAFSSLEERDTPKIYIVRSQGGTPRLVTPLAQSYWHGWSPDGSLLVYAALRGGNVDVYSIPAAGGAERRLTTAAGLDDSPDFSPDGRWIYFCSERTGRMQIWRMRPDGAGQEQVTHDTYHDWFPHPSPDGKYLVFVSYRGDPDNLKHPPNQDTLIRVMNLPGGEVRVLARIFGGQGTMCVPSWSPDSQEFACVSHRLVYGR